MLPATTEALVLTPNLLALLDAAGRERLMEKHKDLVDMMVGQIVEKSGVNLLDPTALLSVGILPSGPAGAALLSSKQELGVIFLSLSDATAFGTFLESVGKKTGKPLEKKQVGDATIFFKDRLGPAMVVRGDVLMMIIGDRPGESMPAAQSIAELQESNSLLTNTRFQSTVATIKGGTHIAGYVDVPALVKDELADRATLSDGKSYEEQMLEEAKASGDPDAIARAEGFVQTLAARHTAEDEIINGTLKAIDAVAFALDLEGSALALEVDAVLSAGSLLHRLPKRTELAAGIVRGTAQRPLSLTSVHLDTAAVMDLVKLMVASEGDDFDALKAMAKAEADLSVDELWSLLSGEFGFSVIGKLEANKPPQETLGGHFIMGITDAVQWTTLMAPLMQEGIKSGDIRAVDGGFAMDIPGFMTVYFGIAGTYVYASTDAAFAKRLTGDANSSFATTIDNPTLRDGFTTPAAMLISVDSNLFTYFIMEEMDYDIGPQARLAQDPAMQGSVLAKKIEAVQKDAGDTDRQRKMDEAEALKKVLDPMGVTVFSLRPTDTGFELRGGQFTNESDVSVFIENGITALINNL